MRPPRLSNIQPPGQSNPPPRLSNLAPGQSKLQPLPLSKRPIDIALIVFFCINLFFITYIVDLEQLVITNADHFQYPVWPPAKMIELVHWYGHNFDPVLIARPAWWRATIWIDALFFGPFYAVAIYAYAKGRNWIRFGSIMWASVMLTNVSIILFEEVNGEHATPQVARVLLSNAAWVIFPLIVLYRMWRSVYPFAASPSLEQTT